MASAPSDPDPVLGRLDRDGRLVSADPELAALQLEAGSRIGAELALPQIAAVAELARKLRVPVSRQAVVGRAEQDLELWVRATPEEDQVLLSLERWTCRPAAPARLESLLPDDRELGLGGAADEWATDDQLRLVSLSRGLAERIGTAPAAAVGHPLTRFFRLEEDEDGAMPLLAGIAGRTDFSGQRARLRGEAGTALILRGSAVHGPDGKFAGFRGEAAPESAADTSSEADGGGEIEAVLDEALRSPLDKIIDSAEQIVGQSDARLPSDYAEYATDIAAAARHLLSVVRSMRSESGADPCRIDLAALAGDAAGMLESSAEARGVLVAFPPRQALIAKGEARGVIQILVNLIGNAVRHSPPGGTVTISFERSAEAVRVHVEDQGPGIEPCDQQRIFERFERAQNAQDGEGGTGLGLAIARRLARAMGGDVTVESVPGEGARFTLCLLSA